MHFKLQSGANKDFTVRGFQANNFGNIVGTKKVLALVNENDKSFLLLATEMADEIKVTCGGITQNMKYDGTAYVGDEEFTFINGVDVITIEEVEPAKKKAPANKKAPAKKKEPKKEK